MRGIRRDEKGVSPVIGVILMVAITVILAAVIASFVFGMGNVVKKAPIISFSAIEANSSTDNITALVYGPEVVNLNPNDFVAVVYVNGAPSSANVGLYADADHDGKIDAGDTIRIIKSIAPGDTVRVIITHSPSGQIVLDATVYAK